MRCAHAQNFSTKRSDIKPGIEGGKGGNKINLYLLTPLLAKKSKSFF